LQAEKVTKTFEIELIYVLLPKCVVRIVKMMLCIGHLNHKNAVWFKKVLNCYAKVGKVFYMLKHLSNYDTVKFAKFLNYHQRSA